MSDQTPNVETRRQILNNKIQQYRAKGYDFEVTARIADKMGSDAEFEEYKKKSAQMYRAAREAQALLDELPDVDTDTDES